MLSVVADDAARSELTMSLDELVDERGHRLVRRNGHAPARSIATGTGQVEVVRPRVDDRRVDPETGQRQQFQSVILPRWIRRSPKVAEVLPLLYLHGLSSSDFVPALTELFGSAAGLSASVICRLTTQWQAEREAFQQRDLAGVDYVYCWADGVHFSIRLGEQGRLCCLVIVGVRADGRKELVAVADGTRESTDDRDVLLTFFDYPAEHWLHLRTTNPIESSFAPVRARTRVTKGPGTRDTGLAMVFKLLQAAEGRWRAVNGPHLVALVRAGARFEAGKLVERPDETPDKPGFRSS